MGRCVSRGGTNDTRVRVFASGIALLALVAPACGTTSGSSESSDASGSVDALSETSSSADVLSETSRSSDALSEMSDAGDERSSSSSDASSDGGSLDDAPSEAGDLAADASSSGTDGSGDGDSARESSSSTEAGAQACKTNADCAAGTVCYLALGGATCGSASGTCVARLAAACAQDPGDGCPCLGVPFPLNPCNSGSSGEYCAGSDTASSCWTCMASM